MTPDYADPARENDPQADLRSLGSIGATAVAGDVRHSGLPVAEFDGPSREVKLLSDHRHGLVVQRSRFASQARWYTKPSAA